MGLLNFILKHFQTTNPSDNGQPPTKTQQGTFLNDDDSPNRKNPIGIFNCDTMDCLSHRLRYIPAQNETIADTMRCPDCGHWMIHEALNDEYGNLSQKYTMAIPEADRFTKWRLKHYRLPNAF